MRRADGAADPVAAVLWGLQDRLSERLDILLQWGTEQACRLPECDLGLARTPLGYKLVATFLSSPPVGEEAAANERGLVVRGQRVLRRGTSHEVQRFALQTARFGVRGGPAYDDGPLRWYPVAIDGSLRMAVPGGELRITPLVPGADASVAPQSDCLLTFEDARRIYPIELASGAELQEEGVALWQRQKVRRALQIRLNGKCVDLRSAGLPGVLGYHAVAERTFIVLAWVAGEIGLFYLDGYEFTLLARLELWDLRHGGPLDVESLMRARANRGVANEGPTVFTEEPAAEMPTAATVSSVEENAPEGAATSPIVCSVGPANSTPRMADWHRELCVRHLTRVRGRLVGRGARKARLLVALLLEAVELCQCDLVGSRTEVHAALEGVLGKPMAGGDRNIRDCLDLLCRESPLFHKDGNRCAVLFAQLHDVESVLIRSIAALEAGEASQLRQQTSPSIAVSCEPPKFDHETTAESLLPRPRSMESVSPSQGNSMLFGRSAVIADNMVTPHPEANPSHQPASEVPYVWVPDVSAFRLLGLDSLESSVPGMPPRAEASALAPPSGVAAEGSDRSTPSPHAPISEFTKPWRPFFDDPDDPFDPELERIDSPSRMFWRSRQKPPDGAGGNQGSS